MRITLPPADLKAFISEHLLIAEYGSDIDQLKKRMEEADEEFCHSFHFTQRMLDRYCYHGFLPMSVDACGVPLLSLKLHRQRVILPPASIRVKKNLLSKFGDHELAVDRDFAGCIAAINRYHPDSWLAPPLAALYRRANMAEGKRVRLHSVELWNRNTLVAGEIGYTVGSGYTSLSGFHTVNSSGTTQLYGLGLLLEREGFRLWDLGMYAPYKAAIGGVPVPREDFLDILASVRDDRQELRCPSVFLRDLPLSSHPGKK